MNFSLKISNIQHINELMFDIDLSVHQLKCIVGKNGIGKTTLIRAIQNFKSADTFTKTASPHIFNQESSIIYSINEKKYEFKYNDKLKVIDTKDIIDPSIKNQIHVEMPIPHGERFNHFKRLSEIDEELRKKISLEEYDTPTELISFLASVYNTNRFKYLREVKVRKSKYYFILQKHNFYIREDYLSSGEFFVISLYKMIQRKCKFIVIDEIDISLDASAQTNLVNNLREFCKKYDVNILFSTHSLALMKTLKKEELYYMNRYDDSQVITLKNTSYNYIKSILFGFQGWDKYILTEDKMLQSYLVDLLKNTHELSFTQYKIIYIGGASNVIDLMRRNSNEAFFSSPENIISILDSDVKNTYKDHDNVLFIPFQSVEKQLFEHFNNGDLPDNFSFAKIPLNGKELYHSIIDKKLMTDQEIFKFINEKKAAEVAQLKAELIQFLTP